MDKRIRRSVVSGILAVLLEVIIGASALALSYAHSDWVSSLLRWFLSAAVVAFVLSFSLHVQGFAILAATHRKLMLSSTASTFILSILSVGVIWVVAIWINSNITAVLAGIAWSIYFIAGIAFALSTISLYPVYPSYSLAYATVGAAWFVFLVVFIMLGALNDWLPLPGQSSYSQIAEILLLVVGTLWLSTISK